MTHTDLHHPTAPQHGADETTDHRLRARTILRIRAIWIFPLVIPAILIALITSIYIGSVVDPTSHLHGLPVELVNEDVGATSASGHVELGVSVVRALEQSTAVTSRLAFHMTSLAGAEAIMDNGGAYATLVIPPTFSASALLDAGAPSTTDHTPPARPTLQLLENSRLGTLGVSLAAGVLSPAMAQISQHVGEELAASSSAATRTNPVLAAQVADPLTLTTVTYRPLPARSALGLSAFYISLLAIMCGFLAGTVVNSSIDGALGDATSDLGPRWRIRIPRRISRRHTLYTKWTVALIVVPILTAVLLVVAIGAFGVYAPNFAVLWLVLTLGALMIAAGTLALLAAFGSIGQLLAMLLLVYLSLASSGGTVPPQALPGFFRFVGSVEPLRQLLGGARDILYFGATWGAGLGHSVLVLGTELAFWLLFGVGFTSWYDHRKLDRVTPEIISYVEAAAARRLDT